MLKRTAKKLFPPHTKQGRFLKESAAKVGLAKPTYFDLEYQHWMTHIEPEVFLPVVKRPKKSTPLFSIVIPFFNTPDKYLHALIDSIVGQSFDDWELIIGDGSNSPERSAAIKKVAAQDGRLKYHKFTKNTDISGNTNQALQVATGDYVAFCDHDDTLSPHALNEMAALIMADSSIDIIYSDEDKLSDDGKWRHHPFFKPDWSPHLFMQTNYTNHLSVIRRSLVEQAGGLRPEFNGAQDYDLLLRIHSLDKKIKVSHVDKILYHWREAEGSTAANFDSKSYAFQAGSSALQEYLERKGIKGTTQIIDGKPGFYRQVLTPHTIKKVIIYVAVSDDEIKNNAVIEKLKVYTKSDAVDVKFQSASIRDIDTLQHESKSDTAIFEFRTVAYPKSTDWLDRLVGVLELAEVATVAPRIISADEQKVVDMGVVYDAVGQPVLLHNGHKTNDMTPNGHTEWVRDVNEPTGAVVGYRSTDKPSPEGCNVVWSYVDFKAYPVFGKSSYFNSNLAVDQEGKIIINER